MHLDAPGSFRKAREHRRNGLRCPSLLKCMLLRIFDHFSVIFFVISQYFTLRPLVRKDSEDSPSSPRSPRTVRAESEHSIQSPRTLRGQSENTPKNNISCVKCEHSPSIV